MKGILPSRRSRPCRGLPMFVTETSASPPPGGALRDVDALESLFSGEANGFHPAFVACECAAQVIRWAEASTARGTCPATFVRR